MIIQNTVRGSITSKVEPVAEKAPAAGIGTAVGLLRDLPIWADPANETELRNAILPGEVRAVRPRDARDSALLGSLERSNEKPFSAFEVADVLSWHVDYRDRVWASTEVISIEGGTLELSVELAPVVR